MPELLVRRLYPTAPEIEFLEARIIAQRNEYALWDFPEYQHVYLGFIEGGTETLLQVLESEVNTTRAASPSATFTLEYHSSCITHAEYPFFVQSFTLIKSTGGKDRQTRELMILSWKLPRKDDYSAENSALEQFLVRLNIEPYDDGSGVPCRIEPEK